MIVSAFSSCFCSRLFSFSKLLIFCERGLIGVLFLPLFFGARPLSWPFSRCLRHVVKWEEYNPSRLNNAPIVPVSFEASASSRILCLYSREFFAYTQRNIFFSG